MVPSTLKMDCRRQLLCLIYPIILGNLVGFPLTFAQPDFLGYFCNFTSNSIYQTNLANLLSTLASNTNEYGFYSSSAGDDPDRANAIVLCRADADVETCRACINNSTSKLIQLCPTAKLAIGWYDYCMLRYSNESMYGIMAGDPRIFVWSLHNVTTNVDQFNQTATTLLDSLRGQAASGGALRKYAAGSSRESGVAAADAQTVYALAQCTPDISERDCSDCLRVAIDNFPLCCIIDGSDGGRVIREGGRVIRPSCHFRYETGRFFSDVVNLPPPGKANNTTRTVVIIIVVLAIIFAIILIVGICVISRKRRQRKPKHKVKIGETGDGISSVESLQYDFDTISVATDNFSDANKLGQGGFGAVYRGKLSNGQDIAVKRLSMNSGQGELEFKNEVILVAKLQHRNLVRLLGFCLEGTERLLIYEYMTNSSLDHFIFDPERCTHLDWDRRYKIIGGIARGLLYLHEDSRLRIIHRDLKASNILLDVEMNPKISDFGMARLFTADETHANTRRIVGTYGYMAPEYVMHGQFSIKSDVFSYGVLVLEIVGGQKNNCVRNGEYAEDLLSFAWKSWKQGTCSNFIDPTLRDASGSMQEMMRCIHIGLLCVQENVEKRPTMASVVLMLNSFSLTLSLPSEPAFFLHSTVTVNPEVPLVQDNNSTVQSSSKQSINDVSITELNPR